MANITPKPGEEVLIHLRKSIFVMRKQMLAFFVAIIVSALLLTYLYKYPAASVAAAILLVSALLYAFYYFIIWFYDVYTITNIRILAFSRKGLFDSAFSEVSYEDVLSVSYNVKGVLSTLFQYGIVTLGLTGGEKVDLVDLSTPAIVQETIKNLIDATKHRKV